MKGRHKAPNPQLHCQFTLDFKCFIPAEICAAKLFVAFGRAVSRIDHPNNYIVPNLFNEFDFICLSFPFQEMTVKVFRTLLLECDARVVDNHEQITFKSLQYIYPNKDFVNSFLCCTHTCR